MEYLLEFDSNSKALPDGSPTFGYPNLAGKLSKTLPPGTDIEPVLRGVLKSINIKEDITLGDLKQFRNTMKKSLNIESRLNSMIKETNDRKVILKEKIDEAIREGRPVYQYYSH